MNILTLNKPNIKDFAKERNNLLAKSKSEWNLFLDSDERLVKPINDISNKNDCYYLYRKNYFLGRYVGTDKLIRLVKKGGGKWQRSVHETWKPNKSHSRGVLLDPVIIHNTTDNLKDYINKINNYSTLHARENFKENKKVNLLIIIFFPIAKFIITYVKSKNVVFSIMQSLHSYLSWTKLYLQQF